MRTLAIDFGETRVGLAISDPDGMVATPLTTLVRRSDADLIAQIAVICRNEEVAALVLGEPRSPEDGSPSPAAERVGRFRDKLVAALALPTRLVEETLTTVEAATRLRAAGVDLRRFPERIDAMAAAIILEDALARGNRTREAER